MINDANDNYQVVLHNFQILQYNYKLGMQVNWVRLINGPTKVLVAS